MQGGPPGGMHMQPGVLCGPPLMSSPMNKGRQVASGLPSPTSETAGSFAPPSDSDDDVPDDDEEDDGMSVPGRIKLHIALCDIGKLQMLVASILP
jgi:hypothetical protein